jgi:hypothetical protein
LPTFEEVEAFVREQTGYHGPLSETISLQRDIGVVGDDLWEFIDAYAARFAVDVADFRWYFHSAEEGTFNLGGLLFPPPNARVREIPITIAMLQEFAERGRWAVEYPPHEPPRSRPDIRVNQFLVLASVAILLIAIMQGCVR